ncbi:hypothetical protein EON65_06090 [archaeon]|nr:MAG: hypothetical protein EON65_06090 [archaeon]
MQRLQALEQDNLNLRQHLDHLNSENFNLQATILTCQAEMKYEAEKEVMQLQVGRVRGLLVYVYEMVFMVHKMPCIGCIAISMCMLQYDNVHEYMCLIYPCTLS